jgi:hypothetical protein
MDHVGPSKIGESMQDGRRAGFLFVQRRRDQDMGAGMPTANPIR